VWKTDSIGSGHVEVAAKQFLPPCQVKCPINEDIQRTNVLISLLPEDEAAAREGIIQIGDYLYEKNPFFNICGYICGLCELECNYRTEGGSIKRRLLKRFLSDTYTEYLKNKPALSLSKEAGKVAVVGGGPAGLMGAYALSKKGYSMTVFEGSDRLGGALLLVPDYRLPKDLLKLTLETLARVAGIEIRYNARVGEGEFTLEKLKGAGYQAVFVTAGTPFPRPLTFEGKRVEGVESLEGVLYGNTYLYAVGAGKLPPDYFKGKKVIVIGGGNVAFDVARSSRRQGGDVTTVCLECEDKTCKDGIPADDEEIQGAWEEGISVVYSRGIRSVRGEAGRFKSIDCPKCISVFDDSGFNPQFDCSDCIDIEGDVLIVTIGQAPDRTGLQNMGLLDERGRLAVDPLTLQSTRDPSVFVGGDVRRVGFMVEAMQEANEAAESIDRYLKGVDMRQGRKIDYEGYGTPIRKTYKPEPHTEHRAPEDRMDFEIFEKGFTLKQAIEEAKRCLTCGPCLSCKACVSIGLQDALEGAEVDQNICSGCGVCVYACNYDAARLVLIGGKLVSETDMFRCKSCGMCVVSCPSGARTLVKDDTDERISTVYASL